MILQGPWNDCRIFWHFLYAYKPSESFSRWVDLFKWCVISQIRLESACTCLHRLMVAFQSIVLPVISDGRHAYSSRIFWHSLYVYQSPELFLWWVGLLKWRVISWIQCEALCSFHLVEFRTCFFECSFATKCCRMPLYDLWYTIDCCADVQKYSLTSEIVEKDATLIVLKWYATVLQYVSMVCLAV
jgi:hypothetical protein